MTATTLNLNQVSAFVRVMEAGSFTEAARALGLPKSSVSRRVSELEGSLGVRLLQRTTRRLVLTEAGRIYFERARAALAGLSDAGAAAADMSRELAGPIRFTAGGDNTGFLISLISEFLALYPKVQLDVVLTPRRVDLVAEGFDLALRAGPLVDSALIVRRVGRTDHGLFAAREYLRKAGTPHDVAGLASHRFVLFGDPHLRSHLRLTGPDGDEAVNIDGPLIVHEMGFAADAGAAGIGIALLPVAFLGWAVKGGLRASWRHLVRVLPDHGVRGSEMNLVSPPIAYEPARVGVFRDFLAEKMSVVIHECARAVEEENAKELAHGHKPRIARPKTPSIASRPVRRPSDTSRRNPKPGTIPA